MTVSRIATSPLIETQQLAAMLGDPRLRVLDCSVAMQVAEDGSYTFAGARAAWLESHVPGSVFVDVLAELADDTSPLPMMLPSEGAFASAMSRLGVGNDCLVVLYDRSNHAWAARVWWMLRCFGFENAAVLNGGWQKWQHEERPTSRHTDSYREAAFTATLRPELMADKSEVLQAIGNPDTRLINALSPEEHRGTAKTRLSRSGRIAGSVNVHCQALIDPDTHTYLDTATFRARFKNTGALEAKRSITYCGGGIAASSDALALTLLGVSNVAVYDGSLAEWSADDNLPMERD